SLATSRVVGLGCDALGASEHPVQKRLLGAPPVSVHVPAEVGEGLGHLEHLLRGRELHEAVVRVLGQDLTFFKVPSDLSEVYEVGLVGHDADGWRPHGMLRHGGASRGTATGRLCSALQRRKRRLQVLPQQAQVAEAGAVHDRVDEHEAVRPLEHVVPGQFPAHPWARVENLEEYGLPVHRHLAFVPVF
ncbi:unnamed protein product, partial [Ixodes hexagonus]